METTVEVSDGPVAYGSRDELGEAFCRGEGVEIGAGSCPTRVHPEATVRYVDKRSVEQLRDYFASGEVVDVESLETLRGRKFDFLIAHHVLEHSATTIETLIEWISLVRDGGVLFLSLPNRHETPDNLRLLTPPTHFVLDYVYGVTEDDFESREHICSFLWSWIDVGGLAGTTKLEAANLVPQALNSPTNDLHWHTFNADTMKFVVSYAAAQADREVELVYLHDGHRSGGEHRAVFRINANTRPMTSSTLRIRRLRESLKKEILTAALEHLEGVGTYSLSAEHHGKLFQVENGKLRWIQSPLTLAERGLAGADYTLFEPGVDASFIGEPIQRAVIDRRAAITSRLAGLEQAPGIELSPGAAPLLDKRVFDAIYLDKVEHTPGVTYLQGELVPVDVVLGDRLIDEVLQHNSYSYLVSSHVIEHVPDFIQFFRSARAVLKVGGKIVMYVPDRRYTFDVPRRDSTVEDIRQAHEQALRAPSREMVLDYNLNCDFDARAEDIWAGTYVMHRTQPPEEAARIAAAAELGATDVHCFTFTPSTMRALIGYVIEHHTPEFQLLEVTETSFGTNEFIVEMQLVRK